jgi:hypothetical protein
MRRFEGSREPKPGEAAVSIKIRVLSGCFHREHSARAYELIDADLRKLSPTQTHLVFEEHESGPEILVYVSLVAAGLGLAAQVINLIAAIIKARSEGIKKGDHPSDPLHLIVRRVHDSEGFREEQVLTIGHTEAIDEGKLQAHLEKALEKLLHRDSPKNHTEKPVGKSGSRKRQSVSSRRTSKKRR